MFIRDCRGGKVCGHLFKKINDSSICIKCGLTIAGNKIFFDKQILNVEVKKHEKKKRVVSRLPCRD